jgi:hypothetical protein
MNAFLNLSFLMMVGTVVVNLIAGALDQRGMSELGVAVAGGSFLLPISRSF